MSSTTKLSSIIKSGVGVIQVVSYETLRIHGEINNAAEELERLWFSWNRIEGLKKWDNGTLKEEDSEKNTPQEILDWFLGEEAKNAILILEDFHPDLTENCPENIRRVRNIALRKFKDRTLILAQPISFLPKELEKEVHIMDLPLPSTEDLKAIYKLVCNNYGIRGTTPNESLIEAALGLTIMEAEKAFSRAAVETGTLSEDEIPIVIEEKEQIIKKSGFLEYYHPDVKLSDIGGLENLKEWLQKRGQGFNKSAKEFGLDTPRGVLLLGIPGTGKSLAAKAIGSEWKFPLLRLDMGRIFGGIVGESEQNIREALKIAEALSPSILWIDEIEKGLSGVQSSGSTDGGTTSRVFGTFLTWMQEKNNPVFVVATANNIAQLPPELLRKGRFDEIFFVDLPDANARKEILSIHLKRKKRNPKDFDLDRLAQKSIGFSGAELEEAVKEALFDAFNEDEDVSNKNIEKAIETTYPLYKTMTETIKDLRSWAKARAKLAAKKESDINFEEAMKDEKVPKLKQESSYTNPFIK